ncbi:hypothetical protein B0H14DRAFT_1044886 [Mycena olivaceomarginata]|nr:hypothetical protein B0H14DRAFT_1044886 [Mycena olivaceomarginata]
MLVNDSLYQGKLGQITCLTTRWVHFRMLWFFQIPLRRRIYICSDFPGTWIGSRQLLDSAWVYFVVCLLRFWRRLARLILFRVRHAPKFWNQNTTLQETDLLYSSHPTDLLRVLGSCTFQCASLPPSTYRTNSDCLMRAPSHGAQDLNHPHALFVSCAREMCWNPHSVTTGSSRWYPELVLSSSESGIDW